MKEGETLLVKQLADGSWPQDERWLNGLNEVTGKNGEFPAGAYVEFIGEVKVDPKPPLPCPQPLPPHPSPRHSDNIYKENQADGGIDPGTLDPGSPPPSMDLSSQHGPLEEQGWYWGNISRWV